jgi:hypothetical protein
MPARDDYAQGAFDAFSIAMSEILEEVKPEAAVEFAKWQAELVELPMQVTAFSSGYDPGKTFSVTVVLGGGAEKRTFETTLP